MKPPKRSISSWAEMAKWRQAVEWTESKADFRRKRGMRIISARTARLASTIKTNRERKHTSWQCVRGFPSLKTSIESFVPIESSSKEQDAKGVRQESTEAWQCLKKIPVGDPFLRCWRLRRC